MGFDPTRQYKTRQSKSQQNSAGESKRSVFDYWYVAIALLVAVGLVLWAVFA